jgi:hypothetical protein
MVCLCSRPFPLIPPYLGGSVDIMVDVGGINLHVTFDKTRIFREARETLKHWIITLGDKLVQENI